MRKRDIKKLTVGEIMGWDDEGDLGYVLCVDLDYPVELHMRDSDYPLAPEKISVRHEQLSPYQKQLIETLGLSYNDKNEKLAQHLGPRKRYIIHYRLLKFYLRKGMILKRIRKVIQFQVMASRLY